MLCFRVKSDAGKGHILDGHTAAPGIDHRLRIGAGEPCPFAIPFACVENDIRHIKNTATLTFRFDGARGVRVLSQVRYLGTVTTWACQGRCVSTLDVDFPWWRVSCHPCPAY